MRKDIMNAPPKAPQALDRALRIDGITYHHATGFMECMRHRRNPEFAEAIRRERSASIAREMGDPSVLKWADMDLGKRALTLHEIHEFETRREDYLREALLASENPEPPRCPPRHLPPRHRPPRKRDSRH